MSARAARADGRRPVAAVGCVHAGPHTPAHRRRGPRRARRRARGPAARRRPLSASRCSATATSSCTARWRSPSRSGSLSPRALLARRASPPTAASSCASAALAGGRRRRPHASSAPTARRCPTTCCCSRSARAPSEAVPGALTFRGPQDSARLRAALERLHAGEPLARRVRRRARDGVDAAAVRARAADRALGAPSTALALEPWVVTYEHTAAEHVRRVRGSLRLGVARRGRASGCGRARSPSPSRTAGCGSAWRAGCRSTSPSRCRARSAPPSPASRPTPKGSCTSTSTAASTGSTTSTPPAT